MSPRPALTTLAFLSRYWINHLSSADNSGPQFFAREAKVWVPPEFPANPFGCPSFPSLFGCPYCVSLRSCVIFHFVTDGLIDWLSGSLSLYSTFTDTLKAFRWHSCMQWLSWNKNWIQLPSFSFIDGLSWSHVNMSHLHVSDCQIINTGPITIFRVRLGVKFFTYFWIALFRCCLFSIASEPKIFEFPLAFQRPGFDPNSLQDGVNIMSRLYLNECIIFAPKFLIKSTIVAKNILNTKKLWLPPFFQKEPFWHYFLTT